MQLRYGNSKKVTGHNPHQFNLFQIFRGNVVEMELPGVDCVNCDVLETLADESSSWHRAFDTIVMNPPFGTKQNAGMDMKFLSAGLNLARGAVYSLHKSSTRYVPLRFKVCDASFAAL